MNIDALDLPAVDFNFEHDLEVGPESCMCTFGIDYEWSIGHSGHLAIARRVVPGLAPRDWPLVYWDDEEQEGTTLAAEDRHWLSGFLAHQPDWARSELASHRAHLVEVAGAWGDDRIGAVIDRILAGEQKSGALHAVIDEHGTIARTLGLAEQHRLRLGRFRGRAHTEAGFAELSAEAGRYNAPLAFAMAGPASSELAWAWLRCNLKYDVGGSIGVSALTKRAAQWLFEHDRQEASPYWPVIHAFAGHGDESGSCFASAGEALLAAGQIRPAITAFENAILIERGWSEEFHMDAFDGIRRAAEQLGSADYDRYLARLD